MLTKENFLPYLNSIIFTAEGMERANTYYRSRGIDPTKALSPATVSPRGADNFRGLEHLFNPVIFEESLFIAIENWATADRPKTETEIAGLDVRYLGDYEARTRYQKFKANPDMFLFYGIREAMENPHLPLVVSEGVLDVESARMCDLPINVIGGLTASHDPRWVSMMLSLSDNIYLAYDNDDAGKKASKKILEAIEHSPEHYSKFNLVYFPDKDLNACLMNRGVQSLRECLGNEIGL